MQSERSKMIGEHVVEEFYWNGKLIVYVNSHLLEDRTFKEACADVEAALDHEFEQGALRG